MSKNSLLLSWIGCSGIGALIGAVFALSQFPGAAFARNPLGQFGWHLIGFALSVGIPLGVSQWLVLRYALRNRKTANVSFLIFWIPITSIGITAVLLPLWSVDAAFFAFLPFVVIIPILPGSICLGLGQWFVLSRAIAMGFNWVPYTIVGVVVGALLGLVIALYTQAPIEETWALITGLSIGGFQGVVLASNLDTD